MTVTYFDETTLHHRAPTHTYVCAACLQAQSAKLKRRSQASANTLKRYLWIPRSAYRHWSASATQDSCQTREHRDESVRDVPAVSSYKWRFGRVTARARKDEVKKRAVFEEDDYVGEKVDQVKENKDEWKMVSEDSRGRIWVNSEGVRVIEKDAWWKSVVNF